LSGPTPKPASRDREPPATLLQIETSKIFVSGVNVRRRPGDVTEIEHSIAEKGILEPLLVRPADGRYELIIGSRRFEAAKHLGLKTVPAVSKPMSDEEALIISLVENIQRRELEPEEEYDALMKLRRLNPAIYASTDDLAKVIGKSRQYVEDRIAAVQTVRTIRKTGGSKIAVREAPTMDERKDGVLPIKHAGFLHRAEEAPKVQQMPEARRVKKLSDLAESIAELPGPEAKNVVDRFVKAPERPIEQIRREAEALRTTRIEVLLDPRVAESLRRAAAERGTTVEALAALAIHAWLRQNKY